MKNPVYEKIRPRKVKARLRMRPNEPQKATFQEAIDLVPPRQGRKKVALRIPKE